MIYLGLLEEYSWCSTSFGFGEGGKVFGSVFCDAGEEWIGKFGVVDYD